MLSRESFSQAWCSDSSLGCFDNTWRQLGDVFRDPGHESVEFVVSNGSVDPSVKFRGLAVNQISAENDF
ncbi:hypothetical protein [Paucibacter sp. M5-1]|uniref:hypothetical protein n=1 Tax=Paucibacter sp. M5-1 TaxID=3015998 RepID=UPI0022B8A85D|nr:hypothetical protein [Paucibacter sp. M5-1]MCZ7880496.1 hypothetical protein [Paucibacter sp. M5-1]